MRNWKIYTIFILFAILLPCFVVAWWKDDACGIYNLEQKWCKEISKNYTQPYCITNFHHSDRDASDVDYAEDCIWPSLMNHIASIREKDRVVNIKDFKKKDFIEQYCLALFWESDKWRIYFAKPSTKTDSWDWQQTFDSHQSLFLHALCSSFTKAWKTPFIIEKNDLVKDAFTWDLWDLVKILKLQQKSEWKDLCSLDVKDNESLDDCDMAIYATKIFDAIMSDLFKIKYAQVLNVDTNKNFESVKMKKVENFMSGYFLIFGKYKDIKDEYPKTVSILESNQRFYKNALDTVKVLNNQKLADLVPAVKCPVDKQMTWLNFIACALHSTQWDGFSLSPSFVTLFYNEILHYRQFISYYEYWMNKRIEVMSEDKMLEKKVRIEQSQMKDFRWYFDMEMDAIKWAQRSFEEFNMTYPLHVWIMMHIEKWEKFRNNSLTKIISSFYSLSEKLQNVQLPLWS